MPRDGLRVVAVPRALDSDAVVSAPCGDDRVRVDGEVAHGLAVPLEEPARRRQVHGLVRAENIVE